MVYKVKDYGKNIAEMTCTEYWGTHPDLQNSLTIYMDKNNLEFTTNIVYSSGIDCVAVRANGGDIIFIISLPPMSNYPVDETEHTHKYTRQAQQAV